MLIIIAALFVFDLIVEKEDDSTNKEDKSNQITSALAAVHDEFGLFGYTVSHEEPIIYINMDATKSEGELKEYLSKQISNKDLEQYRYDIAKRPLEDVETETNLAIIDGVLFEYIEGKKSTFPFLNDKNGRNALWRLKYLKSTLVNLTAWYELK